PICLRAAPRSQPRAAAAPVPPESTHRPAPAPRPTRPRQGDLAAARLPPARGATSRPSPRILDDETRDFPGDRTVGHRYHRAPPMRWALTFLAAALVCATGFAAAGSSAATRQTLAFPWSGTLDGNGSVSGSGQTCSANWSGKLQFDVAGTKLSGSGSVDI